MRRILRTLLRLPFKIAFTPYLLVFGLRLVYKRRLFFQIAGPCEQGKMIDLLIRRFLLQCEQVDWWIDLLLIGLTAFLYVVLLDEFWNDNNTNQDPV